MGRCYPIFPFTKRIILTYFCFGVQGFPHWQPVGPLQQKRQNVPDVLRYRAVKNLLYPV